MSVTGPSTTGGRPRQQSIAHYSRQGNPVPRALSALPCLLAHAKEHTVDRHGRDCVAVCLALPLPHPLVQVRRPSVEFVRDARPGAKKSRALLRMRSGATGTSFPKAPGAGARRRGSSVDSV